MAAEFNKIVDNYGKQNYLSQAQHDLAKPMPQAEWKSVILAENKTS